MAARKQNAEARREYIVVQSLQRGLNSYHTFTGPFTKGEASAYAMHGTTYGDGEYTVEHMTPMQHHEKWILRDVHA
jgi:hypothetical protein